MTIRVKTLFKGILFQMMGHENEVYTFNSLHTAVIVHASFCRLLISYTQLFRKNISCQTVWIHIKSDFYQG